MASQQESSQSSDVLQSLGMFTWHRWGWWPGHAVRRMRPMGKDWAWPCAMNKEQKPHWKNKGSKIAGINKMNKTAVPWIFIQRLFLRYASFDSTPYFTSTSHLSRSNGSSCSPYTSHIPHLWGISGASQGFEIQLNSSSMGNPGFCNKESLAPANHPR